MSNFDVYDMGDCIGRGGMALVYRGRNSRERRLVAIKVPKDELCDDPQFVQRFLREARISAQLNHPAIVQVYDTGQDASGRPYIVMELLKGETLSGRLQRGPLPIRKALTITQAALAALQTAHDKGVVHRDIKPSNIFLTEDGGVKLMDFGIAKAIGECRLTLTGNQMGTPEYMSPEQILDKEIDARTDIYSMGLVLYEMLSGNPPFHADTPFAVINMQMTRETPPLPPDIPEQVRAAVMKATQKEPRQRFASASEMYYALDPKVIVPAYPDIDYEPILHQAVVIAPPDRRPRHRITARTVMLATLAALIVFLAFIVHGIVVFSAKALSDSPQNPTESAMKKQSGQVPLPPRKKTSPPGE